MIEHRCKKCLYWDNRECFIRYIPISVRELKPNPGFCRRRRSAAIRIDQMFVGVHPVQDAEEFCGEYKKDNG